jgi:peptidoglycan hydrolase-like protein with peptidoglycan-binding domain
MSHGRASPDQVKQAQEALQTQGLYHGQLDGKWGPETRHAVAQFQKQKGLKQTAQLDEQTMSDLQSGGDSGGSPSSGSSVPSNVNGQGTPGNGPADSNTNPGGMNGADTSPTH